MARSSPTHPHRRSGGFTLVEMLITVTIMAILAAMAAPSFTRLYANYRMVTTTNDFKFSLQTAKSEAQRRGDVRGVTLRSTSGTGSYDFSTGWSTFTDTGLDGTLGSGDAELQRYAAQAGSTTTIHRVLRTGTAGSFSYADATALAGRMFVTFNSQGQSNGIAAAFFRVCDSSAAPLTGRIVQVSVAGVISLDSSTAVCP